MYGPAEIRSRGEGIPEYSLWHGCMCDISPIGIAAYSYWNLVWHLRVFPLASVRIPLRILPAFLADPIKNLKFPPSKEMAIPVPQGSWDCPCGARSSARRRPSWDSLPRKKMLVSALSITCFVPGRAAVRIADLIFDRRIVFLNTDIIG